MVNKIEFLDYMAAKAMHAILNDESFEVMEADGNMDKVATMSYQMAFAMSKVHEDAIKIIGKEPKLKPRQKVI